MKGVAPSIQLQALHVTRFFYGEALADKSQRRTPTWQRLRLHPRSDDSHYGVETTL
jgi:hypothetical protein